MRRTAEQAARNCKGQPLFIHDRMEIFEIEIGKSK